jgi:hypothetical protein
MFPGECDLSHWHDAPARAGSRDPATKLCGAQNASGNDPTTDNADPTWDWAAEAISDHLDAPDPSICGHHWIIEVDDHHAVIGNAICEESLHASIRANGAVSIKVINGHVRKHANINR